MSGLVGWLTTLTADELAAVLGRRPDAVGVPTPRSLTELAERLAHPYSVVSALVELPTPAMQVAEVTAALGSGCGRADVAAMLGRTDDDADLAAAMGVLAGVAVVWPDGGALRSVPLDEVWGAPLRLGPPAADLLAALPAARLRELARTLGLRPAGGKTDAVADVAAWLSDADRVRSLVRQAPVRVRAVLEKAAHADPVVPGLMMVSGAGGAGPHGWATDRGLLMADGIGWEFSLVMPREVALALRGPDWRAPFDPGCPVPPTVALPAGAVERDAAAAATAVVGEVAAVLEECSRRPLALRKAGGVGARELRRLAKAVDVTETRVRLWLDLAYAADLVAPSEEGTVAPTARYDRWRSRQPADALVDLLAAWRRLECAPLYVTEPARPALAWPDDGTLPCRLRTAVLAAAADLPPGRGVADPGGLAAVVRWRQPLIADELDDADGMVRALWQEAELLGAVARGAASDLGRALDVPEQITAVARRLLPAAETTARFQADLTAVVSGPADGALSDLLNRAADLEARGTASVWRFSTASVRAALDAGAGTDQLIDQLRAVAIGGALPQPLEYLIHDVGRRHGQVRVRPATCCLLGTDPALLAEICATRSLTRLGLSMLAPTVLASGRPVEETLQALRAAGYAPVAESAADTPVIERAAPARAPSEPTADPASTAGPATDLRALAGELLATGAIQLESGTGTVAVLLDLAPHLSLAERRLLAHALDEGAPVHISYTNAQGNPSSRVISDVNLEDHTLFAWCHLRQADRFFSLSRIQGVAPAQLRS
jgi:hypothetical protein